MSAATTTPDLDTVRIRGLLTTGMSERAVADQLGTTRHAVRTAKRAAPSAATSSQPTDDHAERRRPTGMARAVSPRGSVDTLSRWSGLRTILEPPEESVDWALVDFDAHLLSHKRPWQIVDLLTTLSPEVARAVWDYLRLLDPGHEITATRPGTDEPDARAQQVLDETRTRISARHGSEKVMHARLFMGAVVRGAFFAELVLDKSGRLPVGLATPDPGTARFRRETDPVEGEVWQLGQVVKGVFRPLTAATVAYLPVDPKPGSPYGRSLVVPAIFPALFILNLMTDLRRVVAQQGYVRPDIALSMEKLQAMLAGDGTSLEAVDFNDLMDTAQSLIQEAAGAFGSLKPDDGYFHLDLFTVQTAHGVDASATRAAGDMLEALDRMTARGLKTNPLLMGMAEGVSEANANRQWEIFAAGIKSLQQLCEALLERLYGIALQVQGVAASVRVRFAELRSAEELRDQQTLQLKLTNAILMEQQGYADRDEASVLAVGHAAALPAPLGPVDTADTTDPATTQGDGDGSGLRQVSGRAAEKVEPAGDADDLAPLPETVDVDAGDLADVAAIWDEEFADFAGLLEATVDDDEGND